MARRKTKSRRRKFTGINATTTLEAVVQANILSQAATNSSAWDFLTAGTPVNPDTKTRSDGTYTLTLKEIINWTGGSENVNPALGDMGPAEVVWVNLKENWMEAAIQSAFVNVGFRLGSKMLKRPRAQLNKGLRQLGMGDMVRV
jgi:hypothetical protein